VLNPVHFKHKSNNFSKQFQINSKDESSLSELEVQLRWPCGPILLL